MASAYHRQRGFCVVEALDREWQELDQRHPGTVIRWASRHAVLVAHRSFDDVLSVARLYSDPVLAALLTEVSSRDQLAGRVVLQALIGRMVRMAQRDPRASIDDYLALLWSAIGSYPLERRPARIAANLSMDTLKAVCRERRWMGGGEVTLRPSSESLEELLPPAGLGGSRYGSPQPVDVEACRVLEAGARLGVDRRFGRRTAAERLCRRHDQHRSCTAVPYQCGHGPRALQQGSPRAGHAFS